MKIKTIYGSLNIDIDSNEVEVPKFHHIERNNGRMVYLDWDSNDKRTM